MILIIHIIIALSSLIFTGITYVNPSFTKLKISYTLTALMLITGFYLVLEKPTHLTQTCIEGLIFLTIVGYGMIQARNKLTKEI